MNLLLIATIGAGVGFLGGLFGKGGSAVATPLLAAAGVPPLIAVAAPLPATVPSTAIASAAYWRERLVERRVVLWSLAVGLPATALGALGSRAIGGAGLLILTECLLIALGLRFVIAPSHPEAEAAAPRLTPIRMGSVAAIAGLAAGLLANSGGFLLAPLYVFVLRLPLKRAFACSLVVSAVLAVPGTLVHSWLGHIDWRVVAVFGACSVPLSYVGARLAIRTNPAGLERAYGGVLAVLGGVMLLSH